MRYKLFGTHTGLRVSELVLGTSNFGTRWGHGTELPEARRMLDAYEEAGGNILDSSNGYQSGEAEEFLGELLAGRRDRFVVGTKFSVATDETANVLTTGNSRQAMVASLEASLKRLKTDRIDLYWVHVADGVTPMDEILRGFEDLVRQGKILYAGLSDFPAWRVSRAATLAELRGTVPIAGLQLEHSLVARTAEAELIEAGHGLGLGITAFSPLGGGVLTGKYRKPLDATGREEGLNGAAFHPEDTAQRTAILDTVIAVAEDHEVTPGEVAIAWVASKGIFPIIGPRSLKQLRENLAAADLRLSAEEIERLDAVSAIPDIFPYTVLNDPRIRGLISAGQDARIDTRSQPVA
ncbi:aldo/keto reductase [Jiella pelagia]|uniref:Aldo/keto reductase n=1 Tax=Jiella pelagia TaxID=2986949 RepID=A0ABY7BTY2_9HYPH|nr:aldo/keto reductase [Jiella pelagia]WAP67186.1 aldo/keto reductase [Jiella pelagia]